jgi:hypothetical protein
MTSRMSGEDWRGNTLVDEVSLSVNNRIIE